MPIAKKFYLCYTAREETAYKIICVYQEEKAEVNSRCRKSWDIFKEENYD